MAVTQQQLMAYKRGYYDRGLEIERLNALVIELEATVTGLEALIPKQEAPVEEVIVEVKKTTKKVTK